VIQVEGDALGVKLGCMGIALKNRREIAKMREAGKVVNAVLDAVELA
jgi:hypothetical protein